MDVDKGAPLGLPVGTRGSRLEQWVSRKNIRGERFVIKGEKNKRMVVFLVERRELSLGCSMKGPPRLSVND